MSMRKIVIHNVGATGRRLLIGWLVALLLSLALVTTVAASDVAEDAGPEQCAQCHQEEMEAWQNSPHAQAIGALEETLPEACGESSSMEGCECLSCHTTDFDLQEGTFAHAGVTCEACHGPYVPEHPSEGIMQLAVDSSVCVECHEQTTEEWQETAHADAGIQCVGCHVPHSQETRLIDEALCGSCHREHVEDFAHTAHSQADVTCTSCHLSSPPDETLEVGQSGAHRAPSHRFEVASQVCANCHGANIHAEGPGSEVTGRASDQSASTRSERSQSLATELEEVKEENDTLKTMSIVSLGFGLGVGGVLGVILVSVIGYLSRKGE